MVIAKMQVIGNGAVQRRENMMFDNFRNTEELILTAVIQYGMKVAIRPFGHGNEAAIIVSFSEIDRKINKKSEIIVDLSRIKELRGFEKDGAICSMLLPAYRELFMSPPKSVIDFLRDADET